MIPEFKALRNKRGDEASSRILWYIRFLYDPEHEYLANLPTAKRDELLIDYCHIKKSDLKTALFDGAVNYYKEYWMSEPKQAFNEIRAKIREAREALKGGTIYAPSDIKIYSEALKALKELKREYDAAESEFKSDVKSQITTFYGKKDQFIGGADDKSLFQE